MKCARTSTDANIKTDMKQKQQLYIKNGKGRYEPYVPEEPEEDNKLYRKINGKYVPFDMKLRYDTLSEGVWVVTREKSSVGISNAKYLREMFRLEKCSDLDYMPISKIGGLEKCAHYVTGDLDFMSTKFMTTGDFVRAIIGKVFEYFETKNKTE